ncbi:E3 ubiquitin-protein ligase EDD1 [Paragonimus westermani]|uniref:E3 ubiquitin-protein ligase EDD1 n=1 Tax=Paragonimus westermani TaxID=34504 RepID=A0A5J4NTH7_9TREM|nr:E3 ubiquitin-protein ligase EDD1 [Paragonimus westermani]
MFPLFQGLEQLFVTERNTFTRQQLLNSFDPMRMADINPATTNTTEWHNLLMRAGDERRANHTSVTNRPTPVNVRNCPSASVDRAPVRPMFVSALNVDLTVPLNRDDTSTADVTVPHRSSTYVVDASITYPGDREDDLASQVSASSHQAMTPFVPSNDVPHSDTIPERMEVSGPTGNSFMNDDASVRSSVVESFHVWRPPQEEVTNPSSDHQCLTNPSEAAVGFQLQHLEETESLPKRRRTLNETSAVTTTDAEERSQSVVLNDDDAVNLIDDEDRVRASFSLVDGENSVSQASSTGATIATIAGSTLDTLDAASDVTSVSVDTVCNVGADCSAIFMAVSQSENGVNSSTPSSSTAVTLNQPTDLNEFSYTGLLNSDEIYRPSDPAATTVPHARAEDDEDDEPENRHIIDEEDGDNGLASRPQVTVQFPADDNSDGQVSDYDDDDDEDDDEDVDPDEDDGEENEDEEDDDNETDDDDADEDGYGDDAEELIEAEDDDDDDNDDESSHHSDASSVDAGSRSASPTWVPWSQNSVFSRLSSRSAVPPAAADDGSVSLTSTENRRAADSSGPTSVAATSSTAGGTTTPAVSLRSNSNSSRRIVQPVISLLSTTAPSTTTSTLVVSGTGVASSTFGGDATAITTSTGATDGGCIINTQVYLSRAFGCLMRVIADLIAELRENTGSSVSMLRRCASAPTTLLPLLSVYEQQRQLSVYNPNTTSSSCSTSVPVSSTGSHPHTLLLSSPMSTSNLNSVAFSSRPFGPTLTDFRSSIFQPNYSVQNSLPYLGPSTGSSVLGSSATLCRLSSVARPDSHFHATISENELVELVAAVGVAMSPIWQWLSDALDNLEAQLRFSSAWSGRFRRGIADPHLWPVSSSDADKEVEFWVLSYSTVLINWSWYGAAVAMLCEIFYSRAFVCSAVTIILSPKHPDGSGTFAAIPSVLNASVSISSRHSGSFNQPSGRGISHRLSGNLSSGSTNNSRPDQSAIADSASTDSNVLTQRTDFLSYLFSLMRASGGDHGDSVPFVSPTVHKHLAYVLDALLYFFKVFETAWPSGLSHYLWMALDRPNCLSKPGGFPALNFHSPNNGPAAQPLRENTVEKGVSTASVLGGHVAQREDSFFRRSESILSLSGFGLDLIDTPLSEALPLALQPQRLHSTSSRTELFGSARYFTGNPADLSTAPLGAVSSSEAFPICLNAARSAWGSAIADGGRRARPYLDKILQCTDGDDDIPEASLTLLSRRELCIGSGFLDSIGHPATLLSRWCMSLEFFGRHFASDVGAEHRSYILDLGGFTMKEARFRKQMDRLRTVSRRDVVLEVERERSSLIFSTVRQLNAEYAKRQSQNTPSSSSAGGSGLSTLTPPPPTGLGRYSVGHCPVGQSSSSASNNLRLTGSDPSPIAVALLLGTTTDSPLLGTLFGASPAPITSVTSGPTSLGQSNPALLSCQRVKVAFRDEPGEGSGVARSFFTAFSEAVLSPEPLPPFTALLQPTASSNNTSTNSTSQSYAPILFHHRHYTTLSRAPSVSRSPSTSGYTFSNTITIGGSGAGSSTNRSGLAPGSSVNVTGASRSAESTGTGSGVSISFYPYQSQSRLTSRRARTSAWRRAGGLSAGATPFYPTSNSEIVVTDPTSLMHSPPPSHSPVQTVASVPSSPTRDGTMTSSNDTTFIPGLSPGASPSSQHGVQETGRRTLLLRSSLLSVPHTDAAGSVPSVELTAAQQTSDTSVGNRLFARVQSLTGYEELSARITGMLLELPATEHIILLNNEDALRNRVEEARAVLTMSDSGEREHPNLHRIRTPPPSSAQSHQPILERLVNRREVTQSTESLHATAPVARDAHTPVTSTTMATVQPCADTAIEPERVPLFWQPGLQGYYFPRAVPGANLTTSNAIDPVNLAARYSIYRGVGRVIGFCLLTNETCPIQFNRPVLNYLLGRVLHWHDFAFHDPTTYEGLRHLLRSASPETEESVVDYNLTFSIIPAHEEGGLNPGSVVSQQSSTLSHNLAPNGDEIDVTDANVYEFVKRYAEFKMMDAVREPLEQLRLGVFDVLPRNALDGLTAEDLRLLLNGAGDIDTEVLVSYTTFHDETRCGSAAAVGKAFENGGSSNHLEKVSRLKRWFWNTVRAMDNKQRQNLLYFWTSSPTLPASAQGFQPMPSINIRPADDHHLPTANTCISRLYLPLYSSKHILREKLLQAIETKSFGFV